MNRDIAIEALGDDGYIHEVLPMLHDKQALKIKALINGTDGNDKLRGWIEALEYVINLRQTLKEDKANEKKSK